MKKFILITSEDKIKDLKKPVIYLKEYYGRYWRIILLLTHFNEVPHRTWTEFVSNTTHSDGQLQILYDN